MKMHEYRVVNERTELGLKINALQGIIGCTDYQSLPAEDQNLLVIQLEAMRKYHHILALRIERFAP